MRGLCLLSQAVPVVVATAHLWDILCAERYDSSAFVDAHDDFAVALAVAFQRHGAVRAVQS